MNHKFINFIPEKIEDDTLYISLEYGTASHKCCCGCGNEVITPITPTDWKIIFDGETVSLHPSIGNWSFNCQSHYWIKNDQVRWANKWSQDEIKNGRLADTNNKEKHFSDKSKNEMKGNISFIARIKKFFKLN